MHSKQSYEFDFSISFAGPDRPVADELAQKLAQRGLVVFYDEFYTSRLLGKQLDREFEWTFGRGTRFFVPLISRSYRERAWPQLEWAIACKEAQHREDFILPLRLDDTPLLGMPDSVGFLDLRQLAIDRVVDILADKHREAIGFGIRGARPLLERWVATFGVNVGDLVSSGYLPEDAPANYPSLCDWLEMDILRRLISPVRNARFTEASARNGETLSVRLQFDWIPRQEALTFGRLDWWQVLEIVPYEYLYKA